MLLHGFTATPQEMRGLGESLHAAGYTVCGIRVAGHGTSVEDLARTSWRDWVASAREGLAELRHHTDRVVAAGLSMGALLALTLAHDHPEEVDGVAALSTALLLRDRRIERYLPVLRGLAALLPRRWQYVRKGGRDIADPAARASSPSYDTMPLRALINLVELQRHTRRLVPMIRQPVLVVHARQDHACGLDNVTFLQRHLPAPPRVELLERSFHVISVDYEKARVAELVRDFVATVARRAAPPAGR